MSFLGAYMIGDPVCVDMPVGTMTVMGFVVFPDGVGWMDDACLQDYAPHPAIHQLYGDVQIEATTIRCAGHVFRELTQDDSNEVLAAWNWACSQTLDMVALHDSTEYDLRVDRMENRPIPSA